jgi:hypothetical protein
MRIVNSISMKFIVEIILVFSILYFAAYCLSIDEKNEIVKEYKVKKGGGWARGLSDGMRETAPYFEAFVISIFYYLFWYLRIIKKTKETS